MVVDDLEPDSTVADIKAHIAERLRFPPGRVIHLSSWGVALNDDFKTLQECNLRTGGQLEMRTTLCAPNPERGLRRVRVTSSALETRRIEVDPTTTGGELKQRFQAMLTLGEYEWFDKAGTRKVVTGTTLITTAKTPADSKTETVAMQLGEEFITSEPINGEVGKGKPLAAVRARSKTGYEILINDSNVTQLQLVPEQLRLSFRGLDVPDDARLWDRGVRHDDAVVLEFESPAQPPILKILRPPAPPKKEKKGTGKKSK